MRSMHGAQPSRLTRSLAAISLSFCALSSAHADERDQAKRIHDRLAGVPPTETVLETMRMAIANDPVNGPMTAANTAMLNPNFYTVTLKNFAAPWTNRDQSVFVPLNDYITLVMGLVRDSDTYPFTDILTSDRLYIGSGISPLPSVSNNTHYESLEQAMLDPAFDPQTDLTETTQSSTLWNACRRYCRCHNHAGGVRGVLRCRNKPRNVPLYAVESHVHGPRTGARHEHYPGPNSPGCITQPGRRQPCIPEQLHWLSCRYGPDGAGFRVPQLR